MWNREASVKPQGAQPPSATSHPVTNGLQQPGPTSPPGMNVPADERRLVAWVGKSVVFRGDLISSEDMTIDGRIDGSIEVRDHHLTIGPNATIMADVVAKVVTVFGKINGSVTAEKKIEIRQGASVEADLTCQALAIQEGAYFCGKVDMAGRPKTAVTAGQAGSAAATHA
jgi:cytoskeletal protein CcmA (bactofilin family)